MVTSDLTGFRLSPQQEHLWRAQGSRPAGGFVCQGLLEALGPLDRSRLRRAVEQVVERHEILRTAFPRLPGMSLPVQVIQARGEVLWSEPETSGPGEAEIERLLAEARRSPLPLQDGAALQASLISLGEERHALLLTLPGLAADALSLRFLAYEIAALYTGEEAASLPEPLQYADVAESLQDWLGPDDGPGAAFWRQQVLPAHDPADPAVPETVLRRLPAGCVTALASQTEAPVSLLLLAGWAATLWWETGEERRTIAVAHDGRTFDGLSGAVGLFARYLPLQSVAGPGLSLGELARSLEGAAATAAAWQDAFSPDRLATGPAGEGPVPFWPFGFDSDCMVVLSPTLFLRPKFVGLGRFGLRLSVLEEDSAVRLALHYDPSHHDRGQAERLLDRLERVLAAGRETPLGEIDVLSNTERREILVGFNATAAPYPVEATVCDLFEEQVRLAPRAPAVAAAGGVSLTFAELDARANRLARHLRALGIGPESRVGIHLEREPEMVVALLAVLKAGGAYVPFDVGHPAERLRFLLDDAGLAGLVTRERLRTAGANAPGADAIRSVLVDPGGADAGIVSRQDATPPPRLAGPDNAAYVIYTSGSTGLPKGVVVTHRGLVNYLCWARAAYATGPGRGAPVHSPLGFDLTVTSLFVPLLTGAAITLLPEQDGIGALAEALRTPCAEAGSAFGLTKITPAHLGLLRQFDGEPPPSAACLVIGGDTLWAADIAPWRRPGTRIVNEYGPTETVVGCSVHEVGPESPDAGAVPIGRPIANTRLYVMGPGLRPVPAGAPGELWVGGDGVARGYLGRPGLTAERFVPDLFAPPERAGGRLYRTGDLVRLGSAGSGLELEFLGRIDDQVKIRGHRVEPGEVAAALASHPGLRNAAVALRGAGGDRHLIAWVVARDRARRPAASELRRFLAERLPEPMIPTAYVHLDVLPLTPNGKLDRRALPDPDRHRDGEAPYAPPCTLSEEVLVEVWGQVLGVDRVGIDDPFFSLGGDSIRSLQVLALVQKRGFVVTLQDLFERPTIRSLAGRVRIDTGEAQAAATVSAPFSLVAPADRARLPQGVEDAYPLARLQTGMLFHSEHSPESAVYHDQHSASLQGHYDHALLQKAVNQVVSLHPVLRTSFDLTDFNEPLQLVHREIEIPVTEEDLRHLEPEAQREAIEDWLRQERQRGFDWRRPPLIRIHVHRRGEESFQFSFSFHHAVLDGWSAASLLTQLFARYLSLLEDPERPPGSAPDSTFRDFVALESRTLTDPNSWKIWRRQIAGAATTRLPRWPLVKPSPRGRTLRVPFSDELTADLRRLAHSGELPLKSFLLAAHLRVLSLVCGQSEVTTGLISNGRPETMDGEKTLGLFLNALPFCLRVDAESWCELARSAFDLERMLLPHRRFPLAELQAMKGAPLFEISFNFIHFHVYQSISEMRGLGVAEMMGYEETNFPLGVTFHLDPSGTRIQTILNFSESALDQSQVTAIAGYYARALPAMVASPQARPLSTPILANEELHQLLHDWQGRRTAGPALCVHESFALQARRVPGRTAVSCRDRSLTYQELDEKADRLARLLRLRGVRPGSVVAICLERSLEAVIALLGILKAGGAYLPLDPDLSRDRKTLLLGEAHPVAVVTARRLFASLPAERVATLVVEDEDEVAETPDATAVRPGDPRDLAYVLFTSGSTGVPKGVAVEHRQLARYVASILERLDLPDGAIFAMISTFAADLGHTMLFPSLCSGGHLRLVPPEMATDSVALAEDFRRQPVDALKITPGHLDALLSATGGEVLPRRRLVFGGEALRWDLLRRVRAVAPELEILNHYGPTETTVGVLTQPIPEGTESPVSATVPLGTPLPGCAVHVLGPSLDPLPVFVPGELQIGGETVTRGYLGRPDLTAERFVPDPFAEVPGARMYRTGDLGRRLPGGAVEFLGRTDHQVKIRGFRVEPAEIETVLAAHPSVREAVVLANEDAASHLHLVAYLVTADGEPPQIHALRADLEKRLPRHMIPAAFVHLPAFPLNANGKIDRARLPAPAAGDPSREAAYIAPRGPVEEMLAAIWAKVLGVERVGAEDNFFELGGHSLIAIRVIARLRNAFEIDLPLRVLFDAPTVEGLAARIAEVARRADAGRVTPSLVPVPREEPLPLSFAQQRLWFIDQLEPDSPLYNIPVALHVEGQLHTEVLALCLGEIVRRHEVLRTVFVATDGSPVQVIRPAEPFRLPVVDLSGLPERAREARVLALTGEEAARPFDLARGPLLRSMLLRLGEGDHIAMLTMHHIVSDGWSSGILVREVTALYTAFAAGRPSPLSEPSVQYADFAVWQRSWLRGEVLESEIAYWRRQLAGLPPLLELPSDRPRPAVQSFRGATRPVRLPAELTRLAQTLSRRDGATLFMVLLAGFQTLLARYSGQQDLAVGTPIAGRNRVEIEELIGFFVNTLVLRGDQTGEPSFRELIGRIRETALAAHLHHDVPFERLVQEFSPERSLAQTPLFQVMFVLQNVPVEALEIPGLRLQPVDVTDRTARFDLTLSLAERNGALAGMVEHSTDLFDTATIDRLLGHFERLLAAALAAPERRLFELPLLGEVERQQILVEWNDTSREPLDGVLVHEAISGKAERSSGALAVTWDGGELTYGELERRSNQLARHLRRLGVGPEVLVGLCAGRSGDLVVGILGILKAGGAYVPLDPEYPEERLRHMLADCGAPVLVAQERTGALATATAARLVSIDAPEPVFGLEDDGPLSPAALPDHPAYVLYTSGSTGRPKGVVVTHAALANSTRARLAFYREPVEAYLLASSFAFDSSVAGLFWTLCGGGMLVLHRDQFQLDLPGFVASLARRRASHLLCLPSLYSLILEHARPGQLDSLRIVIVAGEACPPALVAQHAERLPTVSLVNEYGPTEGTVWSSAQTLTAAPPSRIVSIGRPIANVRLYLLDRDLGPVPAGTHGELWIGGASLARGYLDRPDLTAERFLPDPFSGALGARMYRTGDLVRWLPDGSLDFLGRVDHQVKVRGFRIEPGEIEAALVLQPEVNAAVVVARQDGPSPRLVAYVVPGGGEEPSPAALREALLARLPDYMVPAAWVVLPSLPLTATGKVDRRALPEPEAPASELADAAPRSPIEQRLVAIWAQVLRLDRVGIHDNFFALGGDSILSIQVVARAQREGVRITPRLLFQHQTVAELAAVANTTAAVEAEQGLVTGPAPLTPIQHWFFADDPAEPHHFNQAVLFETARRLHPAPLATALDRIERHHDALRLRFSRSQAGWQQTGSRPGGRVPLTVVDLAALPTPARPQAVKTAAAQAQASLDLAQGPLYRALLLDLGPQEPGRFFWAIHHLAVDGVSWRILLEDLASLYEGFVQGRGIELPAKTTSFRRWAERLADYADSAETEAELSYWMSQPWTAAPRLPLDRTAGLEANTVAAASSVSLLLDAEETRALLQEVPEAYNTQINDALLTALTRGFYDWTGSPVLLVDLEGHGREEIFADVNLSRTTGWFTSVYPVVLDLRHAQDPGTSLKTVKETLRRVPRGGLGYGLLRWASRHATTLADLPQSQIVFNYLGQFDQTLSAGSPFRPARESAGSPVSRLACRHHLLEFNGGVFGGQLSFTCTFSTSVHRRDTVQRLVDAVAARLREIIAHCRAPEVWGYTPSDFPLASLTQAQLDSIVGE